jgi:integrase
VDRPKLTQRTVDQAAYEGSGRQPCLIWDGRLPGFALRIHPSGRKSYVVRYRTRDGRQRWETLGSPPVLTVEQARKAAQRRLGQALEGRDPKLERRQTRLFAELAQAYLDKHSSARKRSHRDDVQRVRDFLVPKWGNRPATHITRAEVAELHRSLQSRGIYVANRVLSLVSHLFSWGEATGMLPESHPNPARRVERFREASRARWLGGEELKRVRQAIDRESSPYVRAFFHLLLLTACRKSELLDLEWSNVDLEQRTLRIPRTKAGRVHWLPLSGAAVSMLEALPREEGNPYVFPGRKAGSSLVNVEKAWERIRKAARVGDVRIHDLRRTAGSQMVQAGVPLEHVGKVLNHSDPRTTQIYAHLGDSNLRQAVELLEAKLSPPPAADTPTSSRQPTDPRRRGLSRRRAFPSRQWPSPSPSA